MKLNFLILFLSFLFSYTEDTLTINPITFDTPSPIGWNAQYKTNVSFPEKNSWRKILMIQ